MFGSRRIDEVTSYTQPGPGLDVTGLNVVFRAEERGHSLISLFLPHHQVKIKKIFQQSVCL